jgi:Tfp pilus assembly protein PilV
MTVLEVTVAMAVTAVIVLGSTAAFMGSLTSVNTSERLGRAAAFAETVLEDLSAQPYDQLLTFNGNTMYDQDKLADSDFEVELTVFVAEVNLIQVSAVLNDLRSGRELGSFTTLRTLQ